jgi:glucans biosynthesis protein C
MEQAIKQPATRQAYLDWLRILAIIGVLLFHSAMAYVAEWEWHIKNKETSNILLEFNFWLHNFRMPLLFFISGTVSYFMLKSRTAGGFIGLRFRRLFIPLVFGMLVVIPPQVYMERLTEGFKGNFWQFYPGIFTTGPYPKGNLSWHHLWFILYLLLYDIICAPVFSWLMSARGRSWLGKLDWLAKGQRIYLIMVVSVILFISLVQKFPETNNLVQDALYFPYWLLFLLAGFFCVAYLPFMESLERNRRISFSFAFLCIVLLDYLRWNGIEPWKVIANGWRTDWRTYAYFSLYPLTAWFWVLTAIGYGKKYLNRPHPVLNYLNEAVYPFYILHQTVIIIVVFYVTRTTDTIGMKYVFTVLITFFLSMGIFHLFIRPFAVTRFLFGMKPKKKVTKPKAVEQSAIHAKPDTRPVQTA